MKRISLLLSVLIMISLLLSSCSIFAPKPDKDVLYVNLTWHQHQPLYYKDADGIYTRPWVRVHATKDYYDMAAILKNFPDVHVTFNLTPVLIRQLDDFANGAKDIYWLLAEKPASQLTEDDKRFILTRFFDANWNKIIAVHPRYQELLDMRGGTSAEAIEAAIPQFTEQDYRDLQLWFNLAWFDPDFLAEEPLKGLVDKGKNFSEEDKAILFQQTVKVIQDVIPLHKEMQENGQIEVITTPYSHPILPLIVDTNLASIGHPGVETPPQFSYPQDALVHLEKSVEIYQDHFGREPSGLWPGEGSVAQVIVPFVIKSGYQWMATGEPVLAKSLGIDSFSRDAKETVIEADDLYRPYYVTDSSGNKLAVFFRDGVISDKIGFTYSGVSGEAAAKDLIQRLENIREMLKSQEAEGPHIVSIILDGENAWENYDRDGKAFFTSFYQLISETKNIKTVTPSEYLDMFPEQRELDDLFPAAWFSPNYDTWIGEAEENLAWDYLGRTRALLAKYDINKVRSASDEAIALAQDYMYLAEGSDWFWWYGADQDSGQDDYFDRGFRALLESVYTSLGEPVPNFVNIPIIQPKPVEPDVLSQGVSTPTIDGADDGKEWNLAAYYGNKNLETIKGVAVTSDALNQFFRVDLANEIKPGDTVGVYLVVPKSKGSNPFSRSDGSGDLLGIAATHLVEIHSASKGLSVDFYQAENDSWVKADASGLAVEGSGKTLELAIPYSILGELETGDEVQFLVYHMSGEIVPMEGPGRIIVPEIGNATTIIEVSDPEGDDHGPGTYTYPTDAIFQGKMYDLKSLKISYDDKNLIFKFSFFGPIPNPWGSPNNLAVQTLDVYVDKDPLKGTGAKSLLPGRNLSLTDQNGWEYAIWAEGWTPQILVPDSATLTPKQLTEANFKIVVDPAARTVTLRIPREVFGDGDPAEWGYAAVVLGQEGYPSSGVWRVRDVNEKSEQWRFGGSKADTNHTRVIDMIWPQGDTQTQEQMMSTYTSSTKSFDQLTGDDFARIQLIIP